MYNNNIIFLIIQEYDHCHFIREYTMTINIFIKHESVYHVILDDV